MSDKILLVSGHGQDDPGAGGGGYNERDTMRQLVNKVKALIPDLVDVYNTALDCYQQNGLATTSYKNVIEFHMDGFTDTNVHGGHVIISDRFNPDKLDIALKDVIKNHIGIKSSLPTGFSKRNNLQNLNVAADRGLSYRLLELGFITNSSDRNKAIGQMDVLAKLIAEAISGKKLGGATVAKAKVLDAKKFPAMVKMVRGNKVYNGPNFGPKSLSRAFFPKDTVIYASGIVYSASGKARIKTKSGHILATDNYVKFL